MHKEQVIMCNKIKIKNSLNNKYWPIVMIGVTVIVE